jgi:hypothetical protein
MGKLDSGSIEHLYKKLKYLTAVVSSEIMTNCKEKLLSFAAARPF